MNNHYHLRGKGMRRKGQFYIVSAVFVVITLYMLSYMIFYDKVPSSNDSPLLELYRIKEITRNVDYILNTTRPLNTTLLLLDNELQDLKEDYNLRLIEFGYAYDEAMHQYNITLKIKGKYNTLIKEYKIKE